mgnify:CR=1 FL=1
MSNLSATAVACANIALIKYWGNKNDALRIPENGSISFNLDSLFTQTKVSFAQEFSSDQLLINGKPADPAALIRVETFLDIIRNLAGKRMFAKVESENNFPIGTGIASSASSFAALSLSASIAIGLDLSEKDLSRLARRGSGSACRSIPAGYVEWYPGKSDEDSYAESIAPANYWNLMDLVVVVSQEHKKVGSTEGHKLACSSPFQKIRIENSPERLSVIRNAIRRKDFQALADMVEKDSNMMHAVMMTSSPSLLYWQPTTIAIMHAVQEWRRSGIPVCYTLDAGPNVHVITTKDYYKLIHEKLSELAGISQVYSSKVGGKAHLIE